MFYGPATLLMIGAATATPPPQAPLVQNRRNFDLAGSIAFVVATGVTVGTVAILKDHAALTAGALWGLLAIAATAALWAAWWAWRRRRWLLAAMFFFLGLGWPGGFEVVLSAALTFGLSVASLARAWDERPPSIADRRAALVPPVPPPLG